MCYDIYSEILTLTYFPIILLSTTTSFSIYSSTSTTTTTYRSVSSALFWGSGTIPEAGGVRNNMHFSIEPNLVVDDEGLQAQVLLDGLQALGHGVGTLNYPWCTVQLSTDHQLRMGQINWF